MKKVNEPKLTFIYGSKEKDKNHLVAFKKKAGKITEIYSVNTQAKILQITDLSNLKYCVLKDLSEIIKESDKNDEILFFDSIDYFKKQGKITTSRFVIGCLSGKIITFYINDTTKKLVSKNGHPYIEYGK